mgnify:CR=1 FL=1
MLVKTLFIFLITLFACSEFLLGTSLIQRPIILGPLVGLVFGQLELGIVMGATLSWRLLVQFHWCVHTS